MLYFPSSVVFSLLLTLSGAVATVNTKFINNRNHDDVPKRIRKQRELKEKSQRTQNIDNDFSLDMQCDDLLPAQCLNYMQNYLNDYINVDRSYNKLNIPVKFPYNKLDPPVTGDIYDTIEAELFGDFS